LGVIAAAVVGIPIATISANMSQSSTAVSFIVLWVLVVFCVWGVATVATARRLLPGSSFATTAPSAQGETRSVKVVGRRQFLIQMGAATATVTVVGTGLGRVLEIDERNRLEAELEAIKANMPKTASVIDLPNENDPLKPALGTRPEYTAVRDHYKVFIRSEPTVIDGATWTLPITGLVDNPVELTLDDFRTRYEARNEFVTLSCISNRVGGPLIGTTYWTGASLRDILADVRPQGDARYLLITSGDGFYETVDLDLIDSDDRIMLAYNWDGGPIPFDHGFPLRIWLPDRYGMKQPKWITGIEVTAEYVPGYWVERDWDEVARVKATSVIDTVAVHDLEVVDGQGYIPVGGIAFAGARGVSRVEVRVDGGAWEEAKLRSPLSETTWVIWRYEWPFQQGEHTFEVRCAEADGTPQIEENKGNRPDGASGIHRRKTKI
jgi:DMSO/TMAO reductase YedYZ molybdopterin-dependent catalytic subunit